MLGKYRDFLKMRDGDRNLYKARAANEIVLRATDAIYAATHELDVKQRVEDWSRARDALPDLHQRLIEDERAATEAPTGRRPIAAIQERAVSNMLRESAAIQDPITRVGVSTLAFQYAPAKSPQREMALSQILSNLSALPNADQQIGAAKFVIHNSNSHSKVRREAAAKLAELQKSTPGAFGAARRFWHRHVSHTL
jgi:hypothetical protein